MEELNGSKTSLGTIIVTVIITAIVFGGGVYLLTANKKIDDQGNIAIVPTKTVSVAPTIAKTVQNDVSDWKTYTNEAKGFSIQYPTNWSVKENAGGNTVESVVSLISPETAALPAVFEGPANLDISVYYYDTLATADGNNPKKYSTFTDMINDKSYFVKTPVEITLGGQKAYESVEGGMGTYYVILAQKDGHIYKIFFDRKGDKAELTETDKQILSTFKFN